MKGQFSSLSQFTERNISVFAVSPVNWNMLTNHVRAGLDCVVERVSVTGQIVMEVIFHTEQSLPVCLCDSTKTLLLAGAECMNFL